ncbi:DUF5133 domain-containing protein [Streptomyces sp. Act-28]
MLLAHPAVLRELVARYESLCAAAQGHAIAPDLQRRLDDVTYTLCVTTGTRKLEHALAAARARLAATAAGCAGGGSAAPARGEGGAPAGGGGGGGGWAPTLASTT